jgi:DNA repair protein RadC
MTLEKKLELKGKEEGREEEKREIAKRMKKDGIDVKTIEKYTGLTKEEIEKL